MSNYGSVSWFVVTMLHGFVVLWCSLMSSWAASPNTALLIQVVDSSGDPLPAEVELLNLDVVPSLAHAYRSGSPVDLPEGTYRITARHLGFARHHRFVYVSGKRMFVQIGLTVARVNDEEPVTLTGRISGFKGGPRIWVKLISVLNSEQPLETPLSLDGSFLFSGFSPGEYVLLIISGRQVLKAQPISCFRHQVVSIDISQGESVNRNRER